MVGAILGCVCALWRASWYLLFFAPGLSSVFTFALWRCSITMIGAAILVEALVHLPKKAYYKMCDLDIYIYIYIYIYVYIYIYIYIYI